MVQPTNFVKNGRIQVGALGTVLLGSTLLAYFQGAASVFLSLVDLVLAVPSFVATFGGQVIASLFGILSAILTGSFTGAIGFVIRSGPLGFVVALAIVLTSFYIASEVRNRV